MLAARNGYEMSPSHDEVLGVELVVHSSTAPPATADRTRPTPKGVNTRTRARGVSETLAVRCAWQAQAGSLRPPVRRGRPALEGVHLPALQPLAHAPARGVDLDDGPRV